MIERFKKTNSQGLEYFNTGDIAKGNGASYKNHCQAQDVLRGLRDEWLNWNNAMKENKHTMAVDRAGAFVYIMALKPETKQIKQLQIYVACQAVYGSYGMNHIPMNLQHLIQTFDLEVTTTGKTTLK